MLGFIKDVVGGLASPLTGALDLVGDAVGLPKLVTNTIKAAVGVATGNVLMVADGALGVMSELTKNPPAQTEFYTPRDAVRCGEGYAPPAPKPPAHEGTQGSHGTSAPAQASGGILDPITLEYRDALRQLSANFDLLEATEGASLLGKNGKIDEETLKKAMTNMRLPEGLRAACRFFVNNPEYRTQVDTAGKGGRPDGTISTKDVQAALAKVNDDIARYGIRTQAPATPAPTPAPVSSTPASKPPAESATTSPSPRTGVGKEVGNIIKDPNMSLEEKLQAILMALTKGLDADVLDTMEQLAAAQDRRNGIKPDESNKKALSDADRNIEFLTLRLQTLMEKRKGMFDLMSNMSTKFNEMAKTAITNLRSA